LVEKVLVAMEVLPNLLQEGMYLGQRTRRLRLRERGWRGQGKSEKRGGLKRQTPGTVQEHRDTRHRMISPSSQAARRAPLGTR
jgi:hypothetical protein